LSQVQIINKKIKIAVMDDEKQIGEIAFNPDDDRTYNRFIDLAEILINGKRNIDSIQYDENELNNKLETIEDFENASAILGKMKMALNIADSTLMEVCKGFDEIFGAGVCDLFMQGDHDAELLIPLIDAVTPYFKKVRDKKTGKYRAKK